MSNPTAATTPKGSSTRDRILAAARKKIVQRGIDGFSLRDLADTLDIRLSNLQYYFTTREMLVLQVMEDEAARDRAVIERHQRESASAEEAFRAILQDLISRWRGDSGVLFSTLGTVSMHSKAYRKLYRSIYASFYLALEEPLRRLNPELPDSEISVRVRLVTALIDGAPMQPRTGNRSLFLQRVLEQAERIAREKYGQRR